MTVAAAAAAAADDDDDDDDDVCDNVSIISYLLTEWSTLHIHSHGCAWVCPVCVSVTESVLVTEGIYIYVTQSHLWVDWPSAVGVDNVIIVVDDDVVGTVGEFSVNHNHC